MYEKTKLRKILIITICVCICIGVGIAIAFYSSRPDKYVESATAAARKQFPDAQVNSLKVADGFAMATVRSPSSLGQASAGNITIFKVNKDDSMTQIANGSSFNAIDLLGLGISLATQAKLKDVNVSEVKQNLINTCGYSNSGVPGFRGFFSSFNPNGWQIDPNTLDVLEQSLATTINEKNIKAKPNEDIICVNAIRDGSSSVIDTKTYINTFTFRVQLITRNGTLTTHSVSFAIGPRSYRNYTLDGQNISI